MAAVYLLKGTLSLFFTGRRYFNNRFWFVTRLSAFLTIDKEKIYISIVPLIRGSYSLKFFNIQYFLASDIWINGQIWLHVQYTNYIITLHAHLKFVIGSTDCSTGCFLISAGQESSCNWNFFSLLRLVRFGNIALAQHWIRSTWKTVKTL